MPDTRIRPSVTIRRTFREIFRELEKVPRKNSHQLWSDAQVDRIALLRRNTPRNYSESGKNYEKYSAPQVVRNHQQVVPPPSWSEMCYLPQSKLSKTTVPHCTRGTEATIRGHAWSARRHSSTQGSCNGPKTPLSRPDRFYQAPVTILRGRQKSPGGSLNPLSSPGISPPGPEVDRSKPSSGTIIPYGN